jgi:hypothetical protein
MKQKHSPASIQSRRQFLATTGAAIAATSLPFGQGFAQQTAKYHRVNFTDPKAPLASYKKAISAMLALPPSDARNWYRNAFVHTLDCPHGNWWFVPWHRGYIGWFEQTCRELSGDQNFALPYWDWTVLPKIPDSFFQGVLNPENPSFIASLAKFEQQLKNPMSDLWKSFSPAQLQQLTARGFNSMDDVWKAVEADPMFFPLNQARTLTQAAPGFDAVTRKAVSLPTLQAALRPTDFVAFGSGIVAQHSGSSTQGILEAQPHNNVHNNIGGFMGDFLSPVDPIFFMHHSNIDRIWDVWTRKQQALGLPTLPTKPADLANWKKEPFLFYINSQGKPVTKNTAGDYATIGAFNYDYQPGSGAQTPIKPSTFSNQHWNAKMGAKLASAPHMAQAEVVLPEALNTEAVADEGASLFASVTLKPGTDTSGVQFHVVVNPPAGAAQVDFNDPSFAGSFSVFGKRTAGHADQPISFTVSIADAVAKLRAAKRLDPAGKLQVHVVASRKGVALSNVDLDVAEISVGAN